VEEEWGVLELELELAYLGVEGPFEEEGGGRRDERSEVIFFWESETRDWGELDAGDSGDYVGGGGGGRIMIEKGMGVVRRV